MTLEELQRKYDHLLNTIRKMRGHQKEYFRYRARSDLDLSKRAEREVDKIIAEEVKNKKSQQKELF
jgi:hypothetical protein